MVNFIKYLYSFEFTKIILIICVIISICLFIGVPRLNKSAIHNAEEWLSGDIQRFLSDKNVDFSIQFDNDEDKLRNRLQAQYDFTRDRAKTHQTIMIYYYSRYYMAISLAVIFGIVATLMMVIISKEGWEKTSNYIIAIFLTTSGLAAYFTAFPSLYEQKHNIEQNKILYSAYLNIEDQILSYSVTKKVSRIIKDKDEKEMRKTELSVFVHDLDNQLATYNKLPIKLDEESIKSVMQSLNTNH